VTNVFDLEPWGSPGGSGTLGGHFFHFFFGVGSGFEPVPGLATRGGGPGIGIEVRDLDLGIDRERIRETSLRSSSRASWSLAHIRNSSRASSIRIDNRVRGVDRA